MRNFSLKKIAAVAAICSGAVLAGQVSAAVVTFNYQNAADGSGKTSARIPASNASLPLGYFVETFDQATAPGLIPGAGLTVDYLGKDGTYIDFVSGASTGCSFNTFGAAAVTTTGGGMAIQKGSTSGVAAAPAGDATCFGFGPRPNAGTSTATVRVDYAPLIQSLILGGFVPSGTKISYLGLYYGSIDTYNNIAFYNGSSLLNTGSGLLSDGVITGAEVLAANGGVQNTGNQALPGSNVYVNIDFAANETFTAFEFRTIGVAFELDNVVIGLTTRNEIPEPASLALLGMGLLGLGAARRRKLSK